MTTKETEKMTSNLDDGMAEPATLLHVPPGVARLTLADQSQASITICVAKGAVLILRPDGRLERGEAFASEDEASVQIFDILSRVAPSWMSALRERAEKAEAELAALKADLAGH